MLSPLTHFAFSLLTQPLLLFPSRTWPPARPPTLVPSSPRSLALLFHYLQYLTPIAFLSSPGVLLLLLLLWWWWWWWWWMMLAVTHLLVPPTQSTTQTITKSTSGEGDMLPHSPSLCWWFAEILPYKWRCWRVIPLTPSSSSPTLLMLVVPLHTSPHFNCHSSATNLLVSVGWYWCCSCWCTVGVGGVGD